MSPMTFLTAFATARTSFSDAEPSFAPGIARPALPTLGWRSWNWFAGDATQAVMEAQASALTSAPTWSSKSLFDLGYNHIGLDDEWQSCTGPDGSFHDPKNGGKPIVNFTKFPSLSGMVAKATKLGLSSGFYGDNCRCHQGEVKANVTHYAVDSALTLASGFTGWVATAAAALLTPLWARTLPPSSHNLIRLSLLHTHTHTHTRAQLQGR